MNVIRKNGSMVKILDTRERKKTRVSRKSMSYYPLKLYVYLSLNIWIQIYKNLILYKLNKITWWLQC